MSEQGTQINPQSTETARPVRFNAAAARQARDHNAVTRKQFLSEFQLNEATLKKIANELGQEPYIMVKSRDGRKPSTRWTRSIEQIWSWNTDKPTSSFCYNLLEQPTLRSDLENLISTQIKNLGYPRVHFKIVERTRAGGYGDHGDNYVTILVQVPV